MHQHVSLMNVTPKWSSTATCPAASAWANTARPSVATIDTPGATPAAPSAVAAAHSSASVAEFQRDFIADQPPGASKQESGQRVQ
jgi:hypothetical protein